MALAAGARVRIFAGAPNQNWVLDYRAHDHPRVALLGPYRSTETSRPRASSPRFRQDPSLPSASP